MNNYSGVTVSADGASVATVQSEVDSTLSIASPPDLLKGVTITSGRGRADGFQGIAWTADGRLVYSSNASGNPQIWIAAADGANARQLTNGQGLATAPACPVTGSFVVYQQFRDNSIHVYRTGLDGSDTRQLTDGQGELNPIVSPDGKWVYFTSCVSGRGRVMKVSTDGGQPTVLTQNPYRRKEEGGASHIVVRSTRAKVFSATRSETGWPTGRRAPPSSLPPVDQAALQITRVPRL